MKLNATQLKWIALITMTIDHIGAYLFPHLNVLRMIGRVSFPIYAFLIAQGYVHTRNPRNYALRLAAFAIATQLIFMMFDVYFINVLFTFFLGIAAIYCYEKRWTWGIAIAFLIAIYGNPDYSYYGVALVLLFYIFRNQNKMQMVSFVILTVLFTSMELFIHPYLIPVIFGNLSIYYGFFVQLLALLSIPFLLSYDGQKGRGSGIVSKYFFYVYYPIHIVILVLLKGVM